jgi:DNA-binding MarR family transcriptional regulator
MERQKMPSPVTARPDKPARSPRNGVNTAKADAETDRRRDVKLGYLIHDVSRLRRTAFDQIAKPLGATRAQWWVIAHLARHDGMVQTQLAALLDVGKASLGALLDRLEATDFIERRPEPGDRRVKRVFLTKNSQQLLEQLVAAERTFNEQVLAGLSDKDRKEMVRLLSIVKETLSGMERSASENGE